MASSLIHLMAALGVRERWLSVPMLVLILFSFWSPAWHGCQLLSIKSEGFGRMIGMCWDEYRLWFPILTQQNSSGHKRATGRGLANKTNVMCTTYISKQPAMTDVEKVCHGFCFSNKRGADFLNDSLKLWQIARCLSWLRSDRNFLSSSQTPASAVKRYLNKRKEESAALLVVV